MLDDLVRHQSGVATRRQLLECGLTEEQIRANIAARRWTKLLPGVYATFSGPPSRAAQIWAAVLRAGSGAVASHQTAAELIGLVDQPGTPIHVTVPHSRTPNRIRGVRLHRSTRVNAARHPTRTPPQTRVEETVVDLTQSARCLDDAIGWLARAVGSRLTTPARLDVALRDRPRLRWRAALTEAVADVAAGCHSHLELAYLRNVERAHGLPVGERQARRPRVGGHTYDDVLYRAYQKRVEIDGTQAHPVHERGRDRRADNRAVRAGDHPMRYGPGDVYDTPCAVAAEVAAVLQAAGWDGRPRRCRRTDCHVP